MRVIDIEKQLAGQVPRVSPWSTPGWLVGWRPYTGRGLVGAGGWVRSLVVGSIRWWLGQFAGGWVDCLACGRGARADSVPCAAVRMAGSGVDRRPCEWPRVQPSGYQGTPSALAPG